MIRHKIILKKEKFDAEGGATVNNNLRVVTEDDLKIIKMHYKIKKNNYTF